jgi:hypothetical protein
MACAVVPFGIIVHLIAEALALGNAAATWFFVLRHIYLIVPLLLATWVFIATLGLNGSHREMVRRCALARAALGTTGDGCGIGAFVAGSVAFFCVTQLIEGAPIASGDFALGLVAAMLGVIVATVMVFAWGRRIARAALRFITNSPERRTDALPQGRAVFVAARCACNAFTLFAPNRPPPSLSRI